MPILLLDNSPQSLFEVGQASSLLLINNDTVNTAWVAPWSAVNTNSIPVPPQGSVTVDGSQQYWGASLSSALIEMIVVPGGTLWTNPVGVQIAIDALGLATADNQATQIGNQATQIGAAADTNGYLGGTLPGALISAAGLSVAKDMLDANSGVTKEIAALIASGSAAGTPGGVPLLNGYTNLITQANFSVTSDEAEPQELGQATLTQPSFEGTISLINATAGAAIACPIQVWFAWLDANNTWLDTDAFAVYPTIEGAAPHIIGFQGPSKGAQVVVYIYNNNASAGNPVTCDFTFNESSRVYSRVKFQTMSVGLFDADQTYPTGIATGGLVACDPAARILAEFSASITDGDTNSYFLPLWNGNAVISASIEANTADLQVYIENPADHWITAAAFVNLFSNEANGLIAPTQITLPANQCILSIKNGYTDTETVDIAIIAMDY